MTPDSLILRLSVFVHRLAEEAGATLPETDGVRLVRRTLERGGVEPDEAPPAGSFVRLAPIATDLFVEYLESEA